MTRKSWLIIAAILNAVAGIVLLANPLSLRWFGFVFLAASAAFLIEYGRSTRKS